MQINYKIILLLEGVLLFVLHFHSLWEDEWIKIVFILILLLNKQLINSIKININLYSISLISLFV